MNWYRPVTKYDVDISSNKEVKRVCLCCHGNMVSLANKSCCGFILSLETCVPNTKFRNNKVMRVCSCCHGNRVPQQQVILLIGTVTRVPLTKYEIQRTGNNKVMRVCSCCHGNSVSLATSQKMDCSCPKEPVYSIPKLTKLQQVLSNSEENYPFPGKLIEMVTSSEVGYVSKLGPIRRH